MNKRNALQLAYLICAGLVLFSTFIAILTAKPYILSPEFRRLLSTNNIAFVYMVSALVGAISAQISNVKKLRNFLGLVGLIALGVVYLPI
jgi:hypothetical protein